MRNMVAKSIWLRMRAFVRADRGDELVEFALAAMLFFTTVFGILEFGQVVWRYNMISDLAQQGARRATVCGSKKKLSSSDCDIQTYITNRNLGLGTTTVTVTPSDLTTLGAGSAVTVQVTNTFTPLTSLIPHTAINLRATTTMIAPR